MEDIRCPMCGKPNPGNLEACQHCQARLIPFDLSSQEDSTDSELPDWLTTEQQDQTPSEDKAHPEADSDSDDWLTQLREDSDSTPVEITAPSEPTENIESENDDWLGRIREMRDEDATSPEDTESPPIDDESSIFDGALPSWMTESDEEPAEEETSEPDASIPDWLSTSEEKAEQDDTSDSVEDVELPEWLTSSSEDEAPSSSEPPSGIPDPTIEPESELPDWLMDSGGREDPPSLGESDDEDIPDLQPTISQELLDIESSEFDEKSEAETPEWLTTTEDVVPGAIPDDEPIDDGIPDWMSGVDDEDEEQEISTILADPDPEAPDWLSGLESEELGWPADTSETDSPGEELEPDWLANISEGASQDLVPEDDDLSPFKIDDSLDESVFEIDELSDLLSGVDESFEISEGAKDADGLAPTELPGWLEAMRPVDSANDDTSALDQGQIEQSGPLAGLSGVLMAEPEIARLKQSPKLSSMLKITEAQQDHITVFKDLLATEGQVQSLPQPIVVSSQGLLRWVSAFILILVVGLVIIGESQLAPSPQQASVPVEVLNISQLINTLSPQDAVLVSFDYEPGTSGEMEAAAAAVVDHLMIRGAYLTLISTSPTGPALAEHFIATVQEKHNYSSGNQYINLGYVPGGASGLRGFVQMPQRIKPLSFDGFDPWGTNPLAGIYSLSDFKMVIVITDDPDIARSWIEQVQPKLRDTPLVAVVSAQAEPILHPYVGGENAQVRGMVGGIIGGAAYEQVIGMPNLARIYWDALNFSLLAAIAIILIGGTFNVFSVLVRNKERGEAS